MSALISAQHSRQHGQNDSDRAGNTTLSTYSSHMHKINNMIYHTLYKMTPNDII